ncbi:glycosyltransferase [Pedobacter sp. G11]|uniref:glycosyltransferase n=1 Tax=Pedobacter sp. G11 TaxID=2482728 RepID=UPI000F5DF418|nr:glycosyltransferase [Pedobacter sp. G11]AZI25839.1 glycosyltransferase [Pedobacter sp. G11]
MLKPKNKICIISHTHLCRNPRALKEALTLAQAGYNVHVLNAVYDSNLLEEDKSLIKNHQIGLQHASDLSIKNTSSFSDRLIKKIADFLVKFLGVETKYALGYAPDRYYKKAEKLNADLYICHQELPVYIGLKLSENGFKVAFDLEDWHSEDLNPSARKTKAIRLLKKAEKFALRKGIYCSTTSNVLAKKLSESYKSKIPAVIYNVFDIALPALNQTRNSILKLVWFSQYIGEGRGIEEFIEILHRVETPLELNLIGNIEHTFKAFLIKQMPKQHQIVFHNIIQNQQLDVALQQFDIGLAIELCEPASRAYTITNKFFQYIQNGLPVIATNTIGQKEIFEVNQPGILINFNSSDYKKLNIFLGSVKKLTDAREMALNMASKYNWKIESLKLIKLVNNALQ